MLEMLCILHKKMRNSWNMRAILLYWSNYTLVETTALHPAVSAENWTGYEITPYNQ